MRDRPYQVLFLCTANSARSILAEALLNYRGRGRFVAHSAGSSPSGQVNPYALAVLEEMQVPAPHPRSKSWHEFATADGQSRDMDYIITVCDNAAGEVCPVWQNKRQAFREAFETLQIRIRAFTELPIAELDPAALKRRLNELGHLRDHSAALR